VEGDKVRVIQKCTTCHSDDGYSESLHGKSVIDGNPDSATCSDCHGLHKIPLLKGMNQSGGVRKEFHTEVCQKCHADKEMMGETVFSSSPLKLIMKVIMGR